MARFIDQHPSDPNPSPEMIAFIKQRLQSGEPDEFGERGINVFVGPSRTFCYTEAPTAEAVMKSHAALGIKVDLDDIEEIQTLP
jgi:hypothetical protein